MLKNSSLLGLAVLMGAGLLLAGCEEEEQGRILQYKPGVYQGEPDSELSEEQLNELRSRMQGQNDI